jgi:hypothetical protein
VAALAGLVLILGDVALASRPRRPGARADAATRLSRGVVIVAPIIDDERVARVVASELDAGAKQPRERPSAPVMVV